MLSVLSVEVDRALLESWRGWIAPRRQPFLVEQGTAGDRDRARDLSPELRDSYTLWKVSEPFDVLWLEEGEFFDLPRAARAELVRAQVRRNRGSVPTVRRWADLLDQASIRSQADGHRFVWWPSLLSVDDRDVLTRIVETGEQHSRHREVEPGTWRRASSVVPAAEALAGTFARSSGPNCFGTVMAAAGVVEVADEWVLAEMFLEWLEAHCRPGGNDDEAGTVLVWSDRAGVPVHAAVTLSDGWALEKPSQCWWTPRTVSSVTDVRRLNRAPGQHLQRYEIRTAR